MKIVISCHGNVAEELIKSAKMILGEIEQVYPVSFIAGEGRKDLIEKYESILKSEKNDVLFLCDLFGGSPFNTAFELSYGNDSEVISGVSLPMLIDVVGLREQGKKAKEIYKLLNSDQYIKHIEEE